VTEDDKPNGRASVGVRAGLNLVLSVVFGIGFVVVWAQNLRARGLGSMPGFRAHSLTVERND
jgi:hypothetical protein